MKVTLFLLFFIGSANVGVTQHSQTQISPQKATRLQVIISAPFGMDRDYLVTPDSLIIDFKTIEGHAHYSKVLTNSEHEDLLSSFSKIYLSNVKPSYKPKTINVSDAASYNISISKGKIIKTTNVYCVRWEPLYTFSKKLDRLLPHNYKINYTSSYFYK